MRRIVLSLLVFALGVAAAIPVAIAAPTRKSLKPAVARAGVATYDLRALSSQRIVSAKLRRGRVTKRLRLKLVRRAARRGKLRVRVPRGRSWRLVIASRKKPPKHTTTTTTTPTTTTPTTTTPTTTTPTSTTPTTTTPTTTTPTAGTPITSWRAVGSAPLSDAEAAARVRPAAETQITNAVPNATKPTLAELTEFHATKFTSGGNTGLLANTWMPTRRHVTGGFTGTTDEIFQWAAHKWGIPEDIVRAVAMEESGWKMSTLGDRETVADVSLYPLVARISSTEAYTSMGIMQIKWRPGSLHPGTEPLRWKSTAFNVDYWAANIRFFYDGYARDWFSSGTTYGAGQGWESIGAWYNPTPWNNDGARAYITRVQNRLAAL